jgi:hypothetical protein
MSVCGTSLFGPSAQYIKTNSGDFIAVEGSSTRERLILSDLRIPYKQILKSRVILKPGQTNFLLNHLGLGDNATFLTIKAAYDKKSVIETSNYVQYNYYDDFSNIYSFSYLLTLTGNSTNRVKQLYLTNPNINYPVYLDILVAVIDDNYSFFNDSVNQSGTSFSGLEYTDIKSFVVGESIVIYDKSSPKRPLIYFGLSYINSITLNGTFLIINDDSSGEIFLNFLTEYDANQANSLINYVLENQNVDIGDILLPDDVKPVITFNSVVGSTGSYISFMGATSGVPYNTSIGNTFSSSISLGTYSEIDKSRLTDLLIFSVLDNRDGEIILQDSNLVISGTSGNVESITSLGNYSLTFKFSDLANNSLDGVVFDFSVI